MIGAGLAVAEDALHRGVEHGLDRPADLGCEPVVPGDHAVGVGPHPEASLRPLPLRSNVRMLHRRAGRDTRVAQRRQTRGGDLQQLFLRGRVRGCRRGDQLRRAGGQPTLSHCHVGQRKVRQPGGGLERRADLARTDSERARHQGDRVACTCVGNALGGLGDHPVDEPANRTELVDNAQRGLRRQRGRVERQSNRVECATGGHQRSKHLFAP